MPRVSLCVYNVGAFIRMMHTKKTKVEQSAGAVLFRRQGNKVVYLLLQHIRGHWAFPKGHVEGSETSIETARREIKEETGISRIRFFPRYKETIKFRFQWPPKSQDAESRLKFVVFYLGEVFTKDVHISEEHKDYQWAPYEKAYKLLKHRNVRELLEKANTRITGRSQPIVKQQPQQTIQKFSEHQ